KDRPVGGLHVPADRGRSQCLATAILPDNPPSRQVENAGFRQRRSYVACALPLCGGPSARRETHVHCSTIAAAPPALLGSGAQPPPSVHAIAHSRPVPASL